MRKIEFRSKWRDTNKPIEYFSEQYIIDACNDDAFIVEQYTGLKDKCGKKIFEGDIVAYSDKSTLLKVGFDNGGFILQKDGKTYVYNINSSVLEIVEQHLV